MVELVPHAVQVHKTEVAGGWTLLQRHEDATQRGEQLLLGAVVVKVDCKIVKRDEAGSDVDGVGVGEGL